jgi:sortase A
MNQFSNKTYSFLKVLRDSEKRRFLVMRTVGNFFVLFAIVGVFITFAPVIGSELGYRYEKFRGIEYEIVGTEIVRSYSENTSAPLAKLLIGDRPKRERIKAASTDFGIVIPKIGANAKIVADVNAGNEKEYQKALLKGVAHAAGTALPGGQAQSNKKIYLFAHSTDNWWNVNRYNAVFFLLKELKRGDEIDIFYKGRRYVYRAVETKIVEAEELSYLVEPSSEEVLVLQTCWPPGTTLKRLIVIAKPVSQLSER